MSEQWEPLLFELTKLVVLSMLMERALAMIFDYRYYKAHLNGYGLSAPIAFAASWAVCHYYQFDVPTFLFSTKGTRPSGIGIFITAAMVAGGSASCIKLFQGVLGLDKDVQAKWKEANLAEAQAAVEKAQGCKDNPALPALPAPAGSATPAPAAGGG